METLKIHVVPLARTYRIRLDGLNDLLIALRGHVLPMLQISDISAAPPTITAHALIKIIYKRFYNLEY